MTDRATDTRVRSTSEYLKQLGVPDIPPAIHPFDPGYDAPAVIGHLRQSHHLMSSLKISMACWMVADEQCSRDKIAMARAYGVPAVTGGGPFEIAVAMGKLEEYLSLCADMGITRIEAGQGFTDMPLPPAEVVKRAGRYGMGVQFEMGKKHAGEFSGDTVGELIEQGRSWLDAGAVHLVVEARESAAGVGLFDAKGNLDKKNADRFARAFGFQTVVFEAPNKPSQFQLLRHFGKEVHLSNVRLEEILRVEIYRRGLHSDAFEESAFRKGRLAGQEEWQR
jgi:phosphosulfolactate synthase